jgi:hypothetical protein
VGIRLGLALGVGGELEEHLLQPGAVGLAQLDERNIGTVSDTADGFGIGIDTDGSARR